MELKFGLSVIFVHLYGTTLASSLKYEHISDCQVHDQRTPFEYDIKLICADDDNENKVFNNSKVLSCSKNFRTYTVFYGDDFRDEYENGLTIEFRNCRLPTMNRNYFKMFSNLHTFLIPNVELEKMQMDIFGDARNLKTLDVSHNNLTEIPSRIFFNATKLEYVDFSYNSIRHIDSMAFDGATSLRTLNLSSNLLELDSRTFNISNLLILDLSNNSLVQLPENAFDKLLNLERLNLSLNAFGSFDVKTFSFLIQLKHLNLKQTNLTNIQLGTFSHQHRLVSLDLSGNGLKELNFQLFYPIQRDLRSLRLECNKLRNLNGFRNSLFPKLNSLSIQGNRFGCMSLAYFMETTDWKAIRLHLDANLINLNKSNIRGIGCKEFGEAEIHYDTPIDVEPTQKAQTTQLRRNFNDDLGHGATVKITSMFICVELTVFLILFAVANRNQIHSQLSKTSMFCQRFSLRHSSNENNVQFSDQIVLIT